MGDNVLADDWECSGSGPVTDIHFWTFSEQILATVPVYVTISTNSPATQARPYSLPDLQVWSRYFNPGQYTVRPWVVQGVQHQQINIENIPDPFVQTVGEIYWLGLRIQQEPPLAWNYSDTRFMDVAVQWDGTAWFPISDSDLAFVITPEPATMCLLGIGAVGMYLRRRRK
jgi:hypothetical protein